MSVMKIREWQREGRENKVETAAVSILFTVGAQDVVYKETTLGIWHKENIKIIKTTRTEVSTILKLKKNITRGAF